MRILHLLSNRKWTERAEPAANLALAQRALGHDVHFACSRWTLADGHERSADTHLQAMGLDPIILEMPKHFSLRAHIKDIPQLSKLRSKLKPDIIHTHMDNAHLLAGLVLHGRAAAPLLVRQSYEPEGLPSGLRTNWLLRHHTDGLITLTERAMKSASRFGLTGQSVAAIEPGIDTERFAPAADKTEARSHFGLPDDSFVVGMVMRIRKDRRPDAGPSVLAALSSSCPNLRVLLVGRGEEVEAVRDQAEKQGVADRLVMPGYQAGPDLVTAYHAMDLLLYPVPGTDPSCRTVREALASGLPVVAGSEGFLADLVEDGKTGVLAGNGDAPFADAVRQLYHDRTKSRLMSAEAAKGAKARFSLQAQAQRTVSFYEGLQSLARASRS